ncbi:hypothetical protein RaK2_00478 [Klebsiella phage vB_KleM_RaK2]|uniref:Uncharacterized protein n=1 Tax=Klebsiella phage vB_KleM_RaK2 TaxID=1147094 RepID=H6X4T5_9CAUD|nr:hypothetical protein F403_gp057 [Klebsiella phage vB_KleM_RaK2]AFA44751.1 hypothetical protein RaK2_00478 [Klebsiella phage vB_KleM_RaK2]
MNKINDVYHTWEMLFDLTDDFYPGNYSNVYSEVYKNYFSVLNGYIKGTKVELIISYSMSPSKLGTIKSINVTPFGIKFKIELDHNSEIFFSEYYEIKEY